MHETTHVLGFSSGNFYNFIDNQNQTIPDSAVLGYKYYSSGYQYKNATMLITPKVKEKVREHFGCDTLEGAELEDGGDTSGTAGSHWEKRLFNSEYMIGQSSTYPALSELTLAAFEVLFELSFILLTHAIGQWMVCR